MFGSRFGLVWAAVTVSSLGDGVRFIALPLLAASLTSDPRQVALVAFAEQLPWLLTALPAGVLADRLDRRRILWIADAARTLIAAGIALAVALHAVSVPLLAGTGFLLGCGETAYAAAWNGLVPDLVAADLRGRANGRLQASALITDTLLGSPLAAVLFGLAAALPFAVDAGSFAIAATLVFLLRGGYRPEAGSPVERPHGLRGDIAEGVRWLARHPLLRNLCLVAAVGNLVGIGLIAILVLYARHTLGLSGLGYALLTASFAIGGVSGALLAPRLAARIGAPRLLRISLLGVVAAAVGAGLARNGLTAGAAVAGYGLANIAWNTTAVTLRQNLVPNALLGRVTMAYQMLAAGAGAFGAATAGLLAHATTLRTTFFVGAALLLIAWLVPLRSPAPAPPKPSLPRVIPTQQKGSGTAARP
ncbi:MFS family permease [Streptacidiphilus sp. MAP12-20]|uniref:MFS transporter n=1 Tax=Streptacidiphilus sp. MAP12-20 TaxID=3156299 RepID=UPI0035150126